MLIINAETRKPGTEQKALGFLRDYSRNPGIAISGLQIPDRHRRRTTEADVVVFMPFAAAVIEVKGIVQPVGGTLSCPVNGRWSMPGIDGDPVYASGHHINPLHQVADPMYDLKNLANELEPRRELFVDGLVLVVPHPGTSVSLDKSALPAGRDVLLGNDSGQLWKWLNRKAFRARTDPWTVELVVAVLAAIGLDQAGIPEEAAHLRAALIREGFTTEGPATMPEAGAAAEPADPEFSTPALAASAAFAAASVADASTPVAVMSAPIADTSAAFGDTSAAFVSTATVADTPYAGAPESPVVANPAVPGNPHLATAADTARTGENLSGPGESDVSGIHDKAHGEEGARGDRRAHDDERDGRAHGEDRAHDDRVRDGRWTHQDTDADNEPFGRPLTERPVTAGPDRTRSAGVPAFGRSMTEQPVTAPPTYDNVRSLPLRSPESAESRGMDPDSQEPEDWSAPPRSRRPSRHRVEAVAVIGALAAVLVCFVWYFAGSHSGEHSDAGNRPAATSTAPAPMPPAPIPPAAAPPAAPAAAEVPAPQPNSGLFPQDARACYPFQPDC
ncbi:nuclease-related domain-containing protein [Nocardia nova]|uniref:nuclease-related domain-containing protein n=1 Tax=Nocardia nova TaxID=37330 RepID=UPI0033C7BC8E